MSDKCEFFGPVILSNDSAAPVNGAPMKFEHTERYGVIESISGDAYHVTWRGGREHVFCRETGRCLESPFGEVRGFVIAAEEMDRFAKILADKRARTSEERPKVARQIAADGRLDPAAFPAA